MSPTDQRLAVIPQLLANDLSCFQGVLLTGSMVFGKYYSVTDQSDIDFIFIVDSSKIYKLNENNLFKQISINDDLIYAFSKQLIDRFWLDYLISDLKVNIGIWEVHFLDAFLKLKATAHKLGTMNPAVQEIRAVDPYGNLYPYVPHMDSYKSVFIKQFPLFINGTPISSPSYCNLIASEVLYDPAGVWRSKIGELIKELNVRFVNVWFDNFMNYVVCKSAKDYVQELRKHTTGTWGSTEASKT